MSAKKKESGIFKVFHAKIEIDMNLKDGETLEEAKNRMRKELKKTDNLSDVMAQLATDYNTMEMNPDSAQGKLSDTFVTKESENREAVEKLGADFKEIIAEVKSKLEFARDEYNYWCDEAKREDEEMKIYQRQYYEEEERLRREALEEEARRKREAS